MLIRRIQSGPEATSTVESSNEAITALSESRTSSGLPSRRRKWIAARYRSMRSPSLDSAATSRSINTPRSGRAHGQEVGGRDRIDLGQTHQSLNTQRALSTLICADDGRLELTARVRLELPQRPTPLTTGCTQAQAKRSTESVHQGSPPVSPWRDATCSTSGFIGCALRPRVRPFRPGAPYRRDPSGSHPPGFPPMPIHPRVR